MRHNGGNPVYKREMTVRTRNLRVPFILLIFNGILAVVTLVSMYMAVSRARVSASVRFAGFIELYGSVMTFEFLLITILAPALTAGSISGERERKTLDLLLTTDMSPADIVFGKLLSAFSQIAVLIISSAPIIFVTFVYGSVNVKDLAEIMICLAVTAAFTGTAGIFFSSLMKRSTASYVFTYVTLAVIMGGTIFLSLFGRENGITGSGAAAYIQLINPVATFSEILNSGTAGAGGISALAMLTGGGSLAAEYRIPVSLAVQAAASVLFAWGAVFFTDPKRHSKNTRRR